MLEKNKLSLSYTTVEDIRDSNINQDISPYGVIEVRKVVNKYDYHVATGNKLGLSKEWAVRLQGSFVYDDITGRIITASPGRMTLYKASWGAMFTPYIDDVSTSSPVINSSKTQVSFSGSYRMMGEFLVDIKGFPIGTTESYGFYQIYFTATPSSPTDM